jgi:hypothetical protein
VIGALSVASLNLLLDRRRSVREGPASSLHNTLQYVQNNRSLEYCACTLAVPRTAKHLVLHLPIGSKEGPYDVGLLTDTGDQLLRTTGMAQFHGHVTDLQVDVDLSRVQAGTYSLGLRQAGLEWTRYPVRVF